MRAFPVSEQKMPLCWALLEISGLRPVIMLLDFHLSQNITEGGEFQ